MSTRLTNKQIAFCNYYVYGHSNYPDEVLSATKCAELAGYSKKTAARIGSQNLQKLPIVDCIADLQKEKFDTQKRRFGILASVAQNALYETALKGRGMARVLAANSLLDRSGHKPTERVIADVTNHDAIKDETTAEQQQQAILDAAEAISGNIVPISRRSG